jgi:hypothetical protein
VAAAEAVEALAKMDLAVVAQVVMAETHKF